MNFPSFLAALALVLGSSQSMGCQNAGCAIGDKLAAPECNTIGCVRSTNALQNLAKTAKRALSEMRVTGPGNASALCGRGNCLTELATTLLLERCGTVGCATPETSAAAATANNGASIQASTLITNEFAALAKRPMRLSPAIPWGEWTERWAFGGLYKPSSEAGPP